MPLFEGCPPVLTFICKNCAGIGLFEHDQLRLATQDEFEALQRGHTWPILQRAMRLAYCSVMARNAVNN